MIERPRDDPGDDVDAAVWMHVEAGAGHEPLVVVRHEWADGDAVGVVVLTERQQVPRHDPGLPGREACGIWCHLDHPTIIPAGR